MKALLRQADMLVGQHRFSFGRMISSFKNELVLLTWVVVMYGEVEVVAVMGQMKDSVMETAHVNF